MIKLNENINVYGDITVPVEISGGTKNIPVLTVTMSYSNTGTNFSFNFNVLEQALVETHKEEVKRQLDEVKKQIKEKMKSLGYSVII